ncbi:MAG: Hpt domain-containing protein [Bdellovibrio sp.]|nr:MAG: Hpt domain-containing protein [Bdellovibrio sp.]
MSIQNLLNQLKEEYIQELPQKIQTIQEHKNNISLLRDDFHKLKGTGKTYGIPEISELAKHMEWITLAPPANFEEALTKAIHLLEQIYTFQTQKRNFSLNENPDFLFIKSLSKQPD